MKIFLHANFAINLHPCLPVNVSFDEVYHLFESEVYRLFGSPVRYKRFDRLSLRGVLESAQCPMHDCCKSFLV